MTDVLWILLAIGLVALNGFFVAAEFALVKIRPTRLAQLVREERAFAKTALWLARRLDRSLSACQLGITIASLGLGWVGEPAVARLLEPVFHAAGITAPAVVHGLSFAIAFSLITAAHLVLGELAPKTFAIRRPEQLALWCAAPMKAFFVVTYPLLRVLDASASAVLMAVGVDRGAMHEVPHSQEELRFLVGHARAHGELTLLEHRLVEAAFEFDETVCRQIMVPRTDVIFLDVNTPFAESLQIAKRAKHTRYPVCDGSLDEVQGIIHMKDLLGISPAAGLDLRSIMRPPKYVPETLPISKLLGHFQATHQHMAVVVDEFGGSVGVVTLENVIERIVGPVQDEFDAETPDIVPDGPGRLRVRGSTPIGKLAEVLGAPLEAKDVDSVGGLIALRLGRVPERGDRVRLAGATVEVQEVRHNRPRWLRVVLAGAEQSDGPGGVARANGPATEAGPKHD